MPLSRESVEHVARLAHIGLKSDELERLTHDLSSIVDHVAQLQKVDTTRVPPTAHVAAITNVWREDNVAPSWPADAVLANAPQRFDNLFEVQAVLE